MKIANTLFATVALIALAGPAFAAGPNLLPGASSSSSDVTTDIGPACALTGELDDLSVNVTPNGTASGATTTSILVTCNTPGARVAIGSNDMKETTGSEIVETDFTDTISFSARADSSEGNGFVLNSRSIGGVVASGIGNTTNVRIRNLAISLVGVAPKDGKLPIAGDYVGTVCVSVDPSGVTALTSTTNYTTGSGTCSAAGAVVIAPPPEA
jgi:hypothetical protein